MKRSTMYFYLRVSVVLAFAVLTARLWYMQVYQVESYRAQAELSKIRYRTVQALRGIIYDRNGQALVRNTPVFDVVVTPEDWPSEPAASMAESRRLSRLLWGSPSPGDIRAKIQAGEATPTVPVDIKPYVTLQTYWRVRAERELLPGVGEVLAFTRHYRQTDPYPLSHIVGYVGRIDAPTLKADTDPTGPRAYQNYTGFDLVGKTGIEARFDQQLHGVNGTESAEFDAANNQITPWKPVERAVPGIGIKLTIDKHFEEQVAADLRAGLNHIGLRQGAAVVMNPRTGEILALVSLPSFNADIYPAKPSPWRNRQLAALGRNPLHPQFDFSVSGSLPPGSIYKIITATAGLEEGVIDPNTTIDDTGSVSPCPGNACPFHGWDSIGLGDVNVVQALAQSSDIFFYETAGGGPDIPEPGLGLQRLRKWAQLYGLGQQTGIELPSESTGLVPSAQYLWKMQHRTWHVGDSYNMGIGQGDNVVTPLQMVRMVSVIANGGSLVKPRIVAGEVNPNTKQYLPGKNFTLVPDVVHPHFVSPDVVAIIRSGLRLGVSEILGTSSDSIDQRLDAAGKTGTAEAGIDPKTHQARPPHAWWVGFAPYDRPSMNGKPQIAVCVVVPKANAEGAYVSAPIANKIMLDWFKIKAPATWYDGYKIGSQQITDVKQLIVGSR